MKKSFVKKGLVVVLMLVMSVIIPGCGRKNTIELDLGVGGGDKEYKKVDFIDYTNSDSVQPRHLKVIGFERANNEVKEELHNFENVENAVLCIFEYTNLSDTPYTPNPSLGYFQNGKELVVDTSRRTTWRDSNFGDQGELLYAGYFEYMKGTTVVTAQPFFPEDDSPITIMWGGPDPQIMEIDFDDIK